MNNKRIKELLNQHGDALIAGQDIRDQLLAAQEDKPEELDGLMQLAALIKNTLVPRPVPAFRASLRQALEYQAPAEIAIASPPPTYKKVLMTVAAAGSLLSIAGLSLILFRRRRGTTQVAVTTA